MVKSVIWDKFLERYPSVTWKTYLQNKLFLQISKKEDGDGCEMKNKLIVSTSTAFCGLIAANVCWAGVTLPSNVRDVADMLQYSAQEQQKKAFATAETKAGVEK